MIGTLDLSDIYKPIHSDLDLFNRKIRAELRSDDPFLQVLSEYLLQISGKHIRPALAILAARLGGEKSDTPIRLAMAIELLHMATLIHDDIIDGSMFRRNQLTVNAKWGTEVSIICGDYLYAKAFSILSHLNDPAINAMFSRCARTMCEGELKQVEKRKSLDMGEDVYTNIILKKTAALFQAACAVGGYVSRQTASAVELLSHYGQNLGLAFQIADDCLDITGKAEHTGKTTGLDIEKNDATLPLIYLYEKLDDAGRDDLKKLMDRLTAEDKNEPFERIRRMVVDSGVLNDCKKRAAAYAGRAVENLARLPESPYKKSLSDLSDYTLQRIT